MKKLLLSSVVFTLAICSIQAQITNRIFTLGNSVTDGINFAGFQAIANQRGNTHILGRQMIPGAPLFLLYNSTSTGFVESPFLYWPNAFANYDWDCISFQPFDRDITGVQGDFTTIDKWINYIKANRSFTDQLQVYIYSRYPRVPGGFTYTTATATMWNDLWNGIYVGGQNNETKSYFEHLLATVRGANLLTKPAAIVPVGDVMYALNQKMIAGSVPGYNKIWDFYSDGIHVNNVGSFTLGATFFATMYKQDPRGLTVPTQYGTIPNAVRDIILETIYEVVFTHPFSGTSLSDIVAPISVSIAPKTANLAFLQSVILTPTVLPSNASNKNVIWSSSNTSIATVNNQGKVTGVGSGVATITGTTFVAGHSDYIVVTVSGLSNFTSVPGILQTWDFGGKPELLDTWPATGKEIEVTTANGVGIMRFGPGLDLRSDGFGTNRFMGTNQTSTDLSASIGGGEYIAFSIKPIAGKLININKLNMATTSEGGNHVYSLFSSVKGFSESQRIGTVTGGFNTNNVISIIGHENLSQEVEFRVYIHDPTANQYKGVGLGAITGPDVSIEGAVVTPIDNIKPSTVPGIAISQITDTGFLVSWSESNDNMIVTGYNVYVNSIKQNAELITGLSYQVLGLTSGTTANVVVRAVDFVGNESDPVGFNTITNRPPTAVLNVDRTAGAAPLTIQVNGLSSTDPDVATGDFVLGFDFNLGDGSPIVNANSATHTYTAPGVYTLSLVVVDTRNMRSTSVTSLINVTNTGSDITPPSQPGAIGITNNQSTRVSIAWGASIDNVSVAGYNVYLNGTKLNSTLVATNSYTITGLIEAVMYNVTIAAVDVFGNVSVPRVGNFITNRKPVALFTGAISGSTPFALSLNATSSFDPDAGDFVTDYLWTIGGVSYGGSVLQTTLSGAGSYPSTLRVRSQNGDLSTIVGFTVTVNPVNVSGVTVSPSSLVLPALQSRQVSALVIPANATNKQVIWTTNNAAVAQVNSFGMVTGLSTGIATITGTAQDGGFFDLAVVTVTSALGASVTTGTIAGWEFSDITTAMSPTFRNPNTSISGISTILVSIAGGLNPGGNVNSGLGFWGQDATTLAASISGNEYVTFTVNPIAGNQVSISEIKFAPNGQSPRTFTLFSSLNGFAAGNELGSRVSTFWCCGENTPVVSIPVTGHNNITGPIEFRIYMHYQAGNGNQWEGVHFGPAPGLDLAVLGSVTSISDTQNPTAPGTITVTGISNSQLNITWGASTDDVAVVGYNVYRNGVRLTSTPINGLVYTFSGLSTGTSYTLSVTSVDLANKESAPTSVVVMTNRLPVAAITGELSGSAPYTVTLSGATSSDPDAEDMVSAYAWSVQGGAPILGQVLKYTFANVGIYPVSLIVSDTRGGVSIASMVNVTVTVGADVTPPTQPGTPSASNVQSNNVFVQWPASFDLSAVSYRVVLNSTTTLTSAVNNVTLSGLNRSVSNTVYVVAVDASNNKSIPSNLLTIDANTAPNAVIQVNATSGNAPFTLSFDGSNSTDGNPGDGIAAYAWSLSGLAISNSMASSTVLSSVGEYILQLRVTDRVGLTSAFTSLVITVTSAPDGVAPSAPGSANAVTVRKTSLAISWNMSTDNVGVVGYNISVNGIRVNSSLVNSNAYTITGLNEATDYLIQIQALDAAANASSISSTTLRTNTNPVAQVSGSLSGDRPFNFSLSGTSSTDADVGDAISMYAWSINGVSYSSSSVVTGTLTTPGLHVFALQVSDSRDGVSAVQTAVVTVTVDAIAPSAPGSVTQTGRSNTSVMLSWLASNDNIGVKTYVVLIDGQRIETTMLTATVSGLMVNTSYMATVFAIDYENNTSGGSNLAVHTNRKPVANIGGVLQGNAPFTLNLNASGSIDPDAGDIISAYIWSINGVVSSTGNTLEANLNEGKYTVALQVSDSQGQPSDVVFATITVIGTPLSVTNMERTQFGNDYIVLRWTNSPNAAYYEVSAIGSIVALTGNVITITGLEPDSTYAVSIVAINSSGVRSAVESATFATNMRPAVSISANTTLALGVPASFTFTAIDALDTDGSVVAYRWIVQNDTLTGEEISYIFTTSGDYNIYLEAIDNLGLTSNKVSVKVTVESTTSVSESEFKTWSVFPNPISGAYLYTSTVLNGFTLSDVSGTVIKQSAAPVNTIEVGDLPAGVYILKSESKLIKLIK